MSQFEAIGVSHPVHKLDNPCVIARTGKLVRLANQTMTAPGPRDA